MTMQEGSSHKSKPHKQSALVLQGGGALGAYEVGNNKLATHDPVLEV